MTKRLLHHLVLLSYKNNQLDAKKVDEIAQSLNRRDLKAYIRALKLVEQQKKVYIALPNTNLYNTTKREIQKVFSKKELVFTEDPSLLLGMRLVDNDMVYEMNLQNTLESILEDLSQQYND